MDPVNVPAKFKVRSFIRSRDNSDLSFGWGLRTDSVSISLATPRNATRMQP